MTSTAQSYTGDFDAPLVRRARRGDLEAFSELIRRYQRPLTAKALGSLRHVEDADDLVQEAFLRAYKNLGSFRDDTRFGPWIHRILGNLIVDRVRRSGREVDGGDDVAAELPDGERGPEEQLLAAELSTRVREALDALPEGRQKEIFQMRYVSGLPIQEIAERLSVHTGTVKTHLFRTSRKLREQLLESAP